MVPEKASTYILLTTFFNLILYVRASSQLVVQRLGMVIVFITPDVYVVVHVLVVSVDELSIMEQTIAPLSILINSVLKVNNK